jgi:hypothetical protein
VTVRFYIDPATGQPHIYGHSVVEDEVEDVLARPMEDRAGPDESRIALGQTEAGRYLRVIYVPDPTPGFGFCHYGVRARREGSEGFATAPEVLKTEEAMKKRNRFPPGWNDARVQQVLAHYEAQSDVEVVAEDEAAYRSTTTTVMKIPVKLVPAVRALLAKRRAS